MWKILFLTLFLASCQVNESLDKWIDYKSFTMTGGTLFSDPQKATTKQLHFDSGLLLGHDVIIEGKLVEMGKYFTHLVLEDEMGKILVVMTRLDNAEELFKKAKFRKIKVLGGVERGKKGFPFISARSINFVLPES
ncbi:MAG: hypothetical protein AB7T49_02060 [Oligoflexales bacterium]